MSEPDPKQVEVMTRLGMVRLGDPEHATVAWQGRGCIVTLLEEQTPSEAQVLAMIQTKTAPHQEHPGAC